LTGSSSASGSRARFSVLDRFITISTVPVSAEVWTPVQGKGNI